MATSLVELAEKRFGKVTRAEERLFFAVALGNVADYSSQIEKENDLSTAANWPSQRILHADRIAWLCTDPEAVSHVTHRGLGIKGARIDGKLDLRYADINLALYFDKCVIPGGIGLLGAEIHSLNLAGTHTGRVSADGIKTEGGIFLRDGFIAHGSVRLLGATIGGDFDCGGGRFLAPGGDALAADGLKVEGSVSLNDGFHAEGQVRLLGATIGGNLDCNAGTFNNPGKDAFSADRMTVEGNAFLSEGFRAAGRVGLPGVTIGGYFIWRGVEKPEDVVLDLRSAKVSTLWMTEESWPGPNKLLLHGLTYEEIDDQSPTTVETRIRWLQRQPPRPFRPQPYEQLAAVLRRDGHDADAKRVLYEKERDRSRFTDLTWGQVPWYRLFGPLIGYGYRPWRAFWISLGLVIFGAFLFGVGHSYGLVTPAKAEAFVVVNGERAVSKEYPRLNPIMFSLDLFTPLIDLDQAEWWLPNANMGSEANLGLFTLSTGGLLRAYMWFHIIAGWTLSSLLFVGLTGSVPGA
jgi:hypothetical protein